MDAMVKCEPLVMKREATDEELEFRYDELTEALDVHTESKANQTPVHWTPVQSNTGHTFAYDLHSVDDVVGERDTELLMTGVPDYVMLGTNRTVAKGVNVTDMGIKMKRVPSNHVREQNILIVMKEGMSATFAGLLADRCKRENRGCDCSPIGVTEAQVLLNINTVFVKQEV
ncbi:unnamed protein product [Oppiella nova]|uniref:Uncharacterized protein n=1 Tax=Oppiella nova TaxID=334625 RepID=A0A7R9M7V0_9ACAR|nr:unnamed protein product [Oppiella nova]CAG2171868.1 unnamed protein product [Oppiella nova]